jgi:hypothetical protein
MIKRFLNFILMAFKANNVKVGNKTVASPSGGATPTTSKIQPKKQKTSLPPAMVLDSLETKILLEALKNSTFKGEMVEVVYTLALKLKNNLDDV